MLEKGYLAYNQFKPSFAHKKHHIEKYLVSVSDAFSILLEAIEKDNITSYLKGPSAMRGFYRLT